MANNTLEMQDTDTTIGIAMHKPYPVPDCSIYMPIHVGAALKPEILKQIQGDNTGDNISTLNPYFCELTALYWLWKNNHSAFKGLVHYRRYFTTHNVFKQHSLNRFERIIKSPELSHMLAQHPVILPKKRHYVIETIYSHYAHTMHAIQLDITEQVLQDIEPEYVDSWRKLMHKRSAHIFNMMIMDSKHFDAYCSWLFPILFELTRRLDPKQYDAFHARYPGRISEMLLNVWIMKNEISVGELPTTFMEHVDWWNKGTSFLKAKFFKQKYTKSF
ncbi:DUF4422 domain-containing protein [Bifidobacterium gallicum]|uniref:Capsular biosynthesis protein n=1 Tax=Bifidobacterium gallicum DSM 20093 = LMG 11596 TaxID=561180 RepID=D1NRT3_9BIFI|nr:DUF4422 domain-containing protein [Bifidobacterium gallicum]EFA23922.1 capsular biosynthesis protein [Bifidobacterium gallicum DSM 20093 = LMG 11596]KFI59101.1 glycosyl transferase [Bifidobacterium gallicum DSM 20093 = LMG 11596]